MLQRHNASVIEILQGTTETESGATSSKREAGTDLILAHSEHRHSSILSDTMIHPYIGRISSRSSHQVPKRTFAPRRKQSLDKHHARLPRSAAVRSSLDSFGDDEVAPVVVAVVRDAVTSSSVLLRRTTSALRNGKRLTARTTSFDAAKSTRGLISWQTAGAPED